MIKEIHFVNWKSFRHAVLPIDSLTVLIGTNASGKTNAVEGLEFLHLAASGADLWDSFTGYESFTAHELLSEKIHGEFSWAARKPETRFTLKALVQGEDAKTDYLYSITIDTTLHEPLHAETLTRIRYHPGTKANPDRIVFYQTDEPNADSRFINVRSYNTVEPYARRWSILAQASSFLPPHEKITGAVKIVSETVAGIFTLEPIPDLMRGYSRLSDNLKGNASNIAGVLAKLPEPQKKELEDILSKYLTQLPEGDIRRIWAEPVGHLGIDAMLYCEEEWVPGQSTLIDARCMSDGTLRFIAILTALLTRPEGSQLIIEEVDAGLHPSRARLLLNMLQEIGNQRRIDVLVTTHNPALLDAMGLKMIPFVVVAHRDRKAGESQLTLLEDIGNLPKLMASGSLGKVVSQGRIEESLSRNSETDS